MKYYTEDEVVSLLVKMGIDQHAIGHEDGVTAVCDMLSEASEFLEGNEEWQPAPHTREALLPAMQSALQLIARSAPVILCTCHNCVGEPPETIIAAWSAMARDFLATAPAGQPAAGDA